LKFQLTVQQDVPNLLSENNGIDFVFEILLITNAGLLLEVTI